MRAVRGGGFKTGQPNLRALGWIQKQSKRGLVTKVTEAGAGERTAWQKQHLLSDATKAVVSIGN